MAYLKGACFESTWFTSDIQSPLNRVFNFQLIDGLHKDDKPYSDHGSLLLRTWQGGFRIWNCLGYCDNSRIIILTLRSLPDASDFISRFDTNISGIDSCFSSCQSDHNKTYHYVLIRVWRYSTGSKKSPTFEHSPAITPASPTPKGSEAYWFYALGACLLLYLVHRLSYKNSSTMNFLPDLWTKLVCERRLTVTKPCDRSWNQCALKLVLAISLEKEMLRGEERAAAEGARLKLRFEMTRVVALLDRSSIICSPYL
ncbi:hypothetical protein VNO77_19067 [Canavalia gladiata]|uniref:Uncharacterized protein n=1 Tax=Canavalia gladiata TaxID=3824 RepID=A0AAN9LLZ9_CANGL